MPNARQLVGAPLTQKEMTGSGIGFGRERGVWKVRGVPDSGRLEEGRGVSDERAGGKVCRRLSDATGRRPARQPAQQYARHGLAGPGLGPKRFVRLASVTLHRQAEH